MPRLDAVAMVAVLIGATSLVTTLTARSASAKTAPSNQRFLAELVAQSFFRGLLEGRLAAIEPLCAQRVRLEGRWVKRPALRQRLLSIMKRVRQHSLKLRKVVVLPLDEMIRRYGPPPKRLASALRPGDLIALARFDQLGAVAALRRQGRFYRVHLLSD